MSDEKPKPVDDLKQGLNLLFRAAKGAVDKIPTDKIESAVKGGANLTLWAAISTTPEAAAASTMSSASATVHAIGFSTSTCLADRAAATATGACSELIVQMSTASMSVRSTSSRQSSWTSPPPHSWLAASADSD